MPFSVTLEAAFASAMTFAYSWATVRLASGSTVLLALGAVLRLEAVGPPHAAAARQLAPATAINVMRTNAGRPSNIHLLPSECDIFAQTVGELNGYCGTTEKVRPK